MPFILKLSETPDESVVFETALKYLKAGKTIAYPTETFYGLGAAFDNEEALRRLWEIKRRPPDKPFPLIAADVNRLHEVVKEFDPVSMRLVVDYWPGPLTILFNARDGLSKFITNKDGKVAVRVPGPSAALRLAGHVMLPITATSANISNEPPAVDCSMVVDYFGDSLDMIIDGGRTAGVVASTIVEVSDGRLHVLRHRAIDLTGFCKNTAQGL